MKKNVLLVVLYLCGFCPMVNAQFYDNGIYYNITSTTEPYTVEITYYHSHYWSSSYSCADSIPSEVEYNGITYTVTSIGQSAFSGCLSLKEVVIPNTITNIGTSAFYDCDSIISVQLPNSVTDIGRDAFGECSNLEVVIIPSSVTVIQQSTFLGCRKLRKVIIGDGVTSINLQAFGYCERLDTVVIGKSVQVIESSAFGGCDSISTLYYNAKSLSVHNDAFNSKGSLYNVYIGDSVESIPAGLFVNDGNLNNVSWGNSVKNIGASAFWGCTSLHINIPNTVTTIGDYAFVNCAISNELIIPDSVRVIGEGAFMGVRPTRIMLGSQLQTIGNNAFGLNNISEITFSCRNLTSCQINFRNCLHLQTVRISDSVNYIPPSLFFNNHLLRKIVIGSGVTTLPDSLFWGCSLVDTIYCNSSLPPIIQSSTFGNVNQFVPVFIPCNSRSWYQLANNWNSFHNFVETGCSYYFVNTSTDNAFMGYVLGGGQVRADSVDTLTAVASPGYEFDHWSDGCTDNPRIITVTQDTSFTAIFTNQYILSLHANDSSMGILTGDGRYPRNSQATILATPLTGYRFDHWSDGVTQNPRIITLTQDTQFTAIFSVYGYYITARTDSASMGSVSGSGYYAVGSTATIAALPFTGYQFSHWNDGNMQNPRQVTVNAEQTFTAYFIPCHLVTAQSADDNKGSVYGGGYYNTNASATLIAMPNTGYHFTQWNDGNTANPRTVTVSADITLTAHFASNNHLVTASSNNEASGVVYGGGLYAPGTTATLVAMPNNGYQFERWSDNNTSNPRLVTVTGDTAFTAIFSSLYWIEVQSNDETMGVVAGGGYFAGNTQAVLSANAHAGYRFVGWSDGNTNNPRIVAVAQNATYTAVFDVAGYQVTTLANNDEMGSVYGGGYIAANTQASLLAVANAGYVFSQWSDGVTANPRQVTITQDSTFTAQFVQYGYYVMASSEDELLGAVYGSGYYPNGSEARLIAAANTGYRFEHWSDGNESNPRVFSVTEDVTLTATFSDQFRIQAVSGDETMGYADGSGTFTYGTQAIIGATAYNGYHFVGWSDGSTENPRIVTVLTDSVFTARFEQSNGIDDAGTAQVTVYPNPTTNVVQINAEGMQSAILYDMQGRKLMETTEQSMNLTGLPSGSYMLQVVTESGLANVRIVKQ